MSDINRRDVGANYSLNMQDCSGVKNVIKVFSGDCYVSNKPDQMMVTVLGSCIAACIRDPFAGVGGMNHFLLPDGASASDAPLRYGAYSMEKLINDILKMGGQKNRLEVKVFGGGNVIESSAMIGDKNVNFIKKYLKQEEIKISQEDLGGTSARRIHYFTDTGKVMMRKIKISQEVEEVRKQEKTYRDKVSKTVSSEDEGDVELF